MDVPNTEISVCITKGNSILRIRLSDVKQITDTKKLFELGREIAIHTAETLDEEENENGNILLKEIHSKLNVQ
jgi:hypothetical protein